VGTASGGSKPKPGPFAAGASRCWRGTESGAARNGEGAGLAGFGIAENMFYMFSAMPF
jgi:hypothetical protein